MVLCRVNHGKCPDPHLLLPREGSTGTTSEQNPQGEVTTQMSLPCEDQRPMGPPSTLSPGTTTRTVSSVRSFTGSGSILRMLEIMGRAPCTT